MLHALDLASDTSTAGAALSGLLLVFLGSTASAFDGYEPTEKRTVRARYRRRAWLSFAGFSLALLGTFLGLLGKWRADDGFALSALMLLFLSFAVVLLAAFLAALDVK